MATKLFQVSYDLHSPGQSYWNLRQAITSKYSWAKPLESSYLVTTDETAVQVRDYLRQYIDQNDSLLVTRLTGELAWSNINTEVENWIHEAAAVTV